MRSKRNGRTTRRGARIFFATDIHGSDACFRKFLNAGHAYECPYLVLGGDLTGKMVVPVVRNGDGTYECQYGENHLRDLNEERKREVIAEVRRFGHYAVVVDRDELRALNDPIEQDRVFRSAVYSSIGDWVTLAEERLAGTGRRVFVAPGNDDFLEIDGALQGSDTVVFAENRCIQLDETHEMVTTGYSNPTPWRTERELPEAQLRIRMNEMVAAVKNNENLIAVLHAPPYDTPLDKAPKLDDDFNVQIRGGAGVEMAAVGSTAVRGFIEDVQPLLALHGHVHESPGLVDIGRTLCVNPGSEYTHGTLRGALVEVGDGEVLRHQLLSG